MSTENSTIAVGRETPLSEGDSSYKAAREHLEHLLTHKGIQTTCLSVESHELKDVRNLRAHFFGCLGIERRIKVLEDETDPIWEQADKLEKENTELYRKNGSKTPDLRPPEDDDEKPPGMRYITALNLQAELKRIAVLRRTPALKGLVRKVRSSLDAWRIENESNVEKVKQQRIDTTRFRPEPLPRVPGDICPATKPRIDTTRFRTEPLPSVPGDNTQRSCRATGPRPQETAIISSKRPDHDDILPEFSRSLRGIINPERTNAEDSDTEGDGGRKPPYDLQRDIKARLIQLERPDASGSEANSAMANVMEPDWQDVDEKIFKGTFPDQQVSVHHLLKEKFKRVKEKTITEKACPRKLSYFHIPVNNMIWVEQAIARYFREDNSEDVLDSGDRTRMVLQDRYWRGQQHDCGADSIVHNRNLRPICEKIPVDVDELYRNGEDTQENLVLFMPYLHWETDRRRNQAANLIEQLDDEHQLDRRKAAQMWKSQRKEARKGLGPAELPAAPMSTGYKEPDYYRMRGKDRDEILLALAGILWGRYGVTEPIPPGLLYGLVQELWQGIRDEDYENRLLIELEEVIEGASPDTIPTILQDFIWVDAEPQERREWRDTLWSIKEVGQGKPTPHALEDIFWGRMKEERDKADAEGSKRTAKDQNSDASTPNRTCQKFTTIFKEARLDEHGRLKPKSNLAQVLVNAARLYEQIITYPDQQIMKKYLFKNASLHPRRTLDQAYFWRLRTTRLRDRDQVVYRYTNAEFAHKYRLKPDNNHKRAKSASCVSSAGSSDALSAEESGADEPWEWSRHGSYEDENGCDQCTRDICKVSRAIMVDQLWMWVLDKDTILTCFPQRYGVSDKDPSGVHQSIRMRVKTRNNPDNHIRSIFDLALIILEECFDTFFDRTRTEDQRPQIMDMFSESIGRVTNKQAIAFKHLWTLSKRLTDIYQSGVEEKIDPSLLLALLNVTPEAELQREIRDIIDELEIVVHIVNQQNEMIKRFVKFAKEILKPRSTSDAPRSVEGDSCESLQDYSQHKDSQQIIQDQYEAFEGHSDDFLSEIEDRIKELGNLKLSAEGTAQNVTELLSLKQQQASVVQAYEAMKQGEETVRQGKAIMVFTVMTIVFLPLSFMSSLFGMNAAEFNAPDPSPSTNSSVPVPDEIMSFWPVTFKRQILIMFTVSFGTVLAVLIPAFSPFIRASISSFLQWSIAKAVTRTGLYRLWLWTGWTSKSQRDGAQRSVQKMKDDVRKKMQQQQLIQSEIRDGVRKAEVKSSPLANLPLANLQGLGAGARNKARGIFDNRLRKRSAPKRDVEKGKAVESP